MKRDLPITVETSKDGTTVVLTDRGAIRTRSLGEKLFFKFEGYITVGMFDPSMAPAAAAFASERRVVLIGDGETWTGYEPGYRNRWTSWLLEHRKRIRVVHLFTMSKMVHMGAQVVNLALRTPLVQMYDSRQAFDRGVATMRPEKVGAGDAAS